MDVKKNGMLCNEELGEVHTRPEIFHGHAQDWQIFPDFAAILGQGLSVLTRNSKSSLSGAEVLRKCDFHPGHRAGAGGDRLALRRAHLA